MDDTENPCVSFELTKREYFAARAMQAMIIEEDRPARETKQELTYCAVDFADALIKQLNKRKES